MINSSNLINKKEQRFQSLVLLTILIVYLVVLAGGIVRGTGSGMGCPDWPKCFGRWIPPTEASQLPSNYQAIYGAKLKGEIEFNAVKTWIEYVNRLLGVLSGFFVFATLITSFQYWRKDKAIVIGSIAAFLLIGANGWLGSRVVATELAQYLISFHLLLAILVVLSLLFVLVRANPEQVKSMTNGRKESRVAWLLLLTLFLTLGQLLLGTTVRETLDEAIKRLGYGQRDSWIDNLDWRFYVHRSFSLVILAFHVAVIYQLRKLGKNGWISAIATWLIVLVFIEILTGVIMAYMGVPAAAQPIHLLLAIIIIGLQFVAWLMCMPRIGLAQKSAQPIYELKI
ncbi:COX15/CtaA family protein [Spirosoma sp. RP8]|uniref:COX15/CtaA family protein n=1 Tax=Spirosoma liriopis TaxID=2937440 RepID=A0ABT0HIY2_9BACT|nr:COX15/CtaA family protein [Spirosoma liriopis]MCK8492121.1 COX15/CtaA family protein [Spirosoma liriopis]